VPNMSHQEKPYTATEQTQTGGIPEFAQQIPSRHGFVLMDSSQLDQGGISLAAAEPDLILQGGPSDWLLLEQELESRRRAPADVGIPDGGAVGYFRFDGSFRFGFYDNIAVGRPGIVLSDQSEVAEPFALDFRSDTGKEHYLDMVRRSQEYIAAGDIYQVCLAHRFSSPFTGDPWGLYRALRKASPAPHAAYLSLGDETILSSSPECFLKISGREISTRPIKGTRPRREELAADERESRELRSSPKEIAELIMITDLERNDLGRICEFGSVKTPGLLELERYAQVFHLVSTVKGTLREGVSHVSAVAACFPGGSISGAPKKRALEIIRELEPVPRGLFTGAIGYFGYNGESQFNIAIRTIIVSKGRAEFHVGAGITADSDPEKEWEETLHKASGILRASGGTH
jgi:para-aminobenzoate synthetase component I